MCDSIIVGMKPELLEIYLMVKFNRLKNICFPPLTNDAVLLVKEECAANIRQHIALADA